MVIPGIAALFYFVLIPESFAARIIYGSTKGFTLIWPFVIFRWLPVSAHTGLFDSLQVTRRNLMLGIGVGTIMSAIMILVYLSPLGNSVLAAGPLIHEKATLLGMLDRYIPAALMMSVIHSFVEEYYWRWFVFGRLRTRTSSVIAHAAAGLAFAAHHLVVTLLYFPTLIGLIFGLTVGAAGIVWSLLYAHTRSLIAPWIAHILCDLAIFGIGYTILFP